jgi:glutaminase
LWSILLRGTQRANEVVDAKANLGELVDLFYQLCSVETTCQGLAAIAATLANAGTSPLTAKYLILSSFFFFSYGVWSLV